VIADMQARFDRVANLSGGMLRWRVPFRRLAMM
jgi:hypothetical protein